MPSELEKFRSRDKKRGEEAAMLGAGITGGLAAKYSLEHGAKDAEEAAKVKRTKRFSDFVGKLEPGDVLFHRRQLKHSAEAGVGEFELPFTEAATMMATKGDPYYHASLYAGRGNIDEAKGYSEGVGKFPLEPEEGKVPEAIKAYRPKVSDAERAKAINYAKKMRGTDYQHVGQMLAHGAEHLFSPFEGPNASCKPSKDGTVCTQFVANAYPDIFKKQYAAPAEMRHAPELEHIAHYNPIGKVTMREKALTRGVYPVLRNLKWGLGAGALAYGGMSLADYFKRHAAQGAEE